ncbi:MAG: monomethylamine corrinoid protein [Methanolobus sp.]|jgi:monomethylamine corrinoid protein|uniref:Methyltransferase cognate corrinoid protein n=1 Tax=Methanolobus tindarius DSM 2278 TaxID=1090322 RepID=W9DR39_METTI|nr:MULTISPECIES: methyltransferase cognate corrinoid protein [Methanolobus]ETA68083.1 methyltransferase cognate corrinoid protein [Methanolobus tindarius DSM 2278]MDI3486593.1 monomethylamine corrinoid protein [Methanolobus sp.]MDK2831613.1 monomethylamine corrinoid protein [Methanolobus sp.]MDK2939422.1 monomethylamine corrinoid protein [Methanolobus sp.]
MSNQELLDKLRDTIVNQDINGCATATQEAVDAGISAVDAIEGGLSVGMKIVGDKFEAAEIYLPQIMMSAKAMNAAMEILTPILAEEKTGEGVGTAITFVQEGDIHDIGHRLVSTMLGANGFKIVDLGVDVPDDTIVDEVKKLEGSKILLVGSALMTTSMLGQKDTVGTLVEENLRDSVKIMFGGAPVSDAWIAEIGADATAENAADAARVALELMK